MQKMVCLCLGTFGRYTSLPKSFYLGGLGPARLML
jgi:hypothetical protein